MSKNARSLTRIIVALAVFGVAEIVFNFTPLKEFEGRGLSDWRFYVFALPFVAAYITAGYDVVVKSVRNLFRGRLMDENFLMTVASVGAFCLCDFEEAVAVMIFYQVGELFQSYAVGKSRKSIAALMDIRPDTATVIRDGVEVTVSPDEVAVGETVVVRAGERVPVDGRVLEGKGSLDVSSLTGESLPRSFAEGDEILSGSVNLSGMVKITAEKEFYDSTVSRILDLVENASSKKAATENFITKFARYYTPAVVVSAVIIGVVPPLIIGVHAFPEWIKRALTFLVVSCPCALVISIPLAFFGGIGGASRRGILAKGGSSLELLARTRTVVFDKTGTITKGCFAVAAVYPEGEREELVRIASIAESGSLHPIARAVRSYAPDVSAEGYTFTEIPGRGVIAEGKGERIVCGNAAFLASEGVAVKERSTSGSAVYLAKNGKFEGCVIVEDTVKDEAAAAIKELESCGIKTMMLTGDGPETAERVAALVGIDEYRASLLPEDKVSEVSRLLSQKKGKETVCFVGDGINDAPVLATADVGISMGGVGSDAAIEASDIVLMHDDLHSIPVARRIARRTIRIATENIVFALGVKAAVLVTSAFGLTGMWLAVFADVGVAVLAILNSMRCLSAGKKSEVNKK